MPVPPYQNEKAEAESKRAKVSLMQRKSLRDCPMKGNSDTLSARVLSTGGLGGEFGIAFDSACTAHVFKLANPRHQLISTAEAPHHESERVSKSLSLINSLLVPEAEKACSPVPSLVRHGV